MPWAGLFDLFRIGIGPSSSHTVGPMIAAGRFIASLPDRPFARITVALYGSLALTGKGHATDAAVMLGLLGERPDSIDPDAAPALLAALRDRRSLTLPTGHAVPFCPDQDILFHKREILPRHTNGMAFAAATADGVEIERRYYSIGGGFIVEEDDDAVQGDLAAPETPYPFQDSASMLAMAAAAGLSIAELQRRNERCFRSDAEISAGIARIWEAMRDCVSRGLRQDGELPGGLRVRRRAPALHRRLLDRRTANEHDPLHGIDWVNLYALAVNEENAAGGRVVTAPTNGAAGIVPAVLHYYVNFVAGADARGVETFLLAATAVGSLIKRNASISGAEVGCQGEVGSASAMAAAGLAAALGGDNRQVENAAEIGLEHNLGLTCDPIAGLVQIPCIERNAIGAVKAINAARLALHGDGEHHVSLDQVIRTMRETGRDMLSKYKETSEGGLAVNAIEC
ncbi:L-serine ammonia-lyase [Pseudoroseomonas deserti]|uniref:L-serine dehydratase n=2 Tax=Teichococcus deserti TaxID=1817963 RepID=A0A1V2H6K0_9PROT|nr:L-serine ammonia-lyase [Pseudoroseomonas deserti]